MPANKGNLSTPHKEKSGNGLTTGASKKKKRCTVKHKRHCKQYLVSERIETLIPWQINGHIAVESRATQVFSIWNILYLQILDTNAIKSLKYVDLLEYLIISFSKFLFFHFTKIQAWNLKSCNNRVGYVWRGCFKSETRRVCSPLLMHGQSIMYGLQWSIGVSMLWCFLRCNFHLKFFLWFNALHRNDQVICISFQHSTYELRHTNILIFPLLCNKLFIYQWHFNKIRLSRTDSFFY